ncbi:hypothetical protein G6F55_006802 [Rhizopus delemar]|uniref:Uncharacterized protein n=2 Tax=Rhizopus TaxID=4842 RepID=A0A9P6YX72_9FUNG|nr:hypothetical protein G6F55_006802 [Rhizopus delemar]KAG1538849.1 hypothetical protein G6F51_009510 [Rhizopus arrhizus]KAG1524543.1 hypothetical protein G6F52_004104 [Rhizopus delemar]KAG1566350.1 hypothetical protein G6F50_009227 [Rhizopus delemar]KAG1625518.1 hypothetical protein G6F45_009112 [Rhizopus arrhizus]
MVTLYPDTPNEYYAKVQEVLIEEQIIMKILVENTSITEAHKRFRKHSIAEVDKNNDINSLRILSLSRIFPLNKFDVKKRVIKCFDNKTRKALKSVASGTKPKINRAPAQAVVYCKNKADEGDDNDGDNDDNDSEEEGEEEKKEEGKLAMMSIIKDIVRQKKQYRASIADTYEATFTEKCVISVIRRILLKNASEDLHYAM